MGKDERKTWNEKEEKLWFRVSGKLRKGGYRVPQYENLSWGDIIRKVTGAEMLAREGRPRRLPENVGGGVLENRRKRRETLFQREGPRRKA